MGQGAWIDAGSCERVGRVNTHTIELPLRLATREQLYSAYDQARKAALVYEENSYCLHFWDRRAEAIDAELSRRRSSEYA